MGLGIVAVHFRGEYALIAAVVPLVHERLVVRLVRGRLLPADDGQAAVARVRAANETGDGTGQRMGGAGVSSWGSLYFYSRVDGGREAQPMKASQPASPQATPALAVGNAHSETSAAATTPRIPSTMTLLTGASEALTSTNSAL